MLVFGFRGFLCWAFIMNLLSLLWGFCPRLQVQILFSRLWKNQKSATFSCQGERTFWQISIQFNLQSESFMLNLKLVVAELPTSKIVVSAIIITFCIVVLVCLVMFLFGYCLVATNSVLFFFCVTKPPSCKRSSTYNADTEQPEIIDRWNGRRLDMPYVTPKLCPLPCRARSTRRGDLYTYSVSFQVCRYCIVFPRNDCTCRSYLNLQSYFGNLMRLIYLQTCNPCHCVHYTEY